MNLKNKIFIIFFVLLAFILFFNINNVFAITYNEIEIRSFDSAVLEALEQLEYYNDEYYYCIRSNQGVIDVFFYKKADLTNFKAYASYSDKLLHTTAINVSSDTQVTWHEYDFKNNEFVHVSTNYGTIGLFYNQGFSSDNGVYVCINANFDIYTDNSYSTVFFQAPPPIVEGITIPALETAEQIPQAIVKTLKIMIPVGLIVLSIGLGIYLIKRVRYSIM